MRCLLGGAVSFAAAAEEEEEEVAAAAATAAADAAAAFAAANEPETLEKNSPGLMLVLLLPPLFFCGVVLLAAARPVAVAVVAFIALFPPAPARRNLPRSSFPPKVGSTLYLLPPSLGITESPEEATTREWGGGEERAEQEEKRGVPLLLWLSVKPAAPAESSLTSLSDEASEALEEEREKRAAQREATVKACCYCCWLLADFSSPPKSPFSTEEAIPAPASSADGSAPSSKSLAAFLLFPKTYLPAALPAAGERGAPLPEEAGRQIPLPPPPPPGEGVEERAPGRESLK